MGNKELCLKLAKADSEKEVVQILKDTGYWDNPDVWQYYGNNENNFATIGNQQSSADSALVEKIVNSVDALLMKECLKRGLEPDGEKAPQSIEKAQDEFFKIPEGVLTNITPTRRSELAENMMIVATGSKSKPSYSIIDKGEGQTPKMIPNTFLSLTKSNKLRIPFVQGKFNMGGTGSLRFSGEKNLQLIISKRCPEIADDDETVNHWGFTLIRREDPSDNMKSSTYKYLAPNNEILTIDSDSLPLLPGDFPNAYEKKLQYGSLVKLYEYKMSMKSLINFDLYRRLSVLLPKIALPVFLKERRAYKGDSFQSVLSGLSVRLEQNKANILEEGFPSSLILNVAGQEMNVDIYAFKKDKSKQYKKNEGIIFTINGQSHGYISYNFFNRTQKVGMNYLAKDILIIVDCSKFDGRSREDLFMNSRDRLSEGALKNKIERALEKIVKDHQGLRELKARRRQEDIGEKISDAKPLAEILESVIKKSPTLSNLLISGRRITNPFNMTNIGTANEFEGKEHPTFFNLKKNFSETKPKGCPINQKFRIQFETDANNDYFTRDNDPGHFKLFDLDDSFKDFNLNLWNGIATLNCELPPGVNLGDLIEYAVEIKDSHRVDDFKMKFFVKVEPPITKKNAGNGQRVKPPGKNGNDRKKPSALNLPNIWEVKKDEWEKHNFDGQSALLVKDSGEEGYDFYVNMSNVYCLSEIKSRTKNDPEILKAQYKFGMVLIGLSLIKSFEDENKEDDEPIFTKISSITKGIAPMIIPMITALGDLEPSK
ncbi:hypothetical protein [Methanobacterium formicicum]|uniref:Uncharacterized protein n=1 Tax=Methanobacterium formicicum TaxID=2162 RepID=A0A0S4FM06_METFO|nr:hypothetical protein [Methanobacterium formicicum]CEL23997.1 hypothetical protein MB9_0349 [Methanobacterium formicicum]